MMMKILITAGIVAVLLFLKGMLGTKKSPPEKSFRCTRCSSVEAYGPRTIEAWNRGFTRLYCQPCHRAWLLNQDPQGYSSKMRTRGGRAAMILASATACLLVYYASQFASW